MKSAPGGFNTFQNAICMKNAWSRDRYEDNVLWLAMHRKGKTMARIVNFFNSRYFDRDREIIRELGNATNVMDFKETLTSYKDENVKAGGIFRKWFNCRISGSQLLKLGTEFFG